MAGSADFDLYRPSEEHDMLRDAIRSLAEAKIAPYAAVVDEEDRRELGSGGTQELEAGVLLAPEGALVRKHLARRHEDGVAAGQDAGGLVEPLPEGRIAREGGWWPGEWLFPFIDDTFVELVLTADSESRPDANTRWLGVGCRRRSNTEHLTPVEICAVHLLAR